jgi:bacterioferritin
MKVKQVDNTIVIINALNIARDGELYAIHQYLEHQLHLEHLGYSKLADEMKTIAIQEMVHSEILGQRIKILGGEPVNANSTSIVRQERLCDIYEFDANIESAAIKDYNTYIETCRTNKDSISEEILRGIIKEEQQHFEYFKNVFDLITDLGDAYLAEQAKPFIASLKRGL